MRHNATVSNPQCIPVQGTGRISRRLTPGTRLIVDTQDTDAEGNVRVLKVAKTRVGIDLRIAPSDIDLLS